MRHPLALVTVALMIGIGVGAFISIPIAIPFCAAALLLVAIRVVKGARLLYASIVLLFLSIGVILITPVVHPTEFPESLEAYASKKRVVISGVVATSPESKRNTTRVVLSDLLVKKGARWHAVNGRLALTVGEKMTDVSLGDTLVFSGRIKRPHNFDNPGGFDYEFYLKRMGVSATSFVESPDNLIVSNSTHPSLPLFVAKVRDTTRRFYDTRFPTTEGGVLKALVLGERGDIPADLLNAYYRTGVGHVLAISGSNVGIAFFFGYLLAYSLLVRCGRFALRYPVRKWAALISFFPVIAYTFLAGLEITVLRATLMIAVFVSSVIIEKEQQLINTLVCAAFLILIVLPASLFDPSFILSFVAVLSIILLYPPIIEPIRRRVFAVEGVRPHFVTLTAYRLVQFAVISIAAIVGILPVAAYYFFRVTPCALLLNFIVVPLLGPVDTTLTLFSVPLIFLVPEAAYALNLVAAWAASLADSAVLWTDSLFPTGFVVFPPTVLEIMLYYGLAASLYLGVKGKRWARPLIAAILVISLVDVAAWAWHRHYPGTLSITFLSVGNGDSTLIMLPDGETILVDAGGRIGEDFDIGQRVVAPYLLHERIRRIDYLVLSHPESDHAGGLTYIVENFSIGEFWIPRGADTSAEISPLLLLAESYGIPVISVDEKTPARAIGDVSMRFLNPPKEIVDDAPTDPNNRSLVFRLSYRRFSLLMTGDIERLGIDQLIGREKSLASTLLKAPHHGSSLDNSTAFLGTVKPRAVVVSCGYENPFGFPGKKTLEAYRRAGAPAFRTDVDGAVTVETDGYVLTIETMRGNGRRLDIEKTD